jgi:streptogramin lyase
MNSSRPHIALIIGILLWNGSLLYAANVQSRALDVATLIKSEAVGLFDYPAGITTDEKGNLYVADQYNDTIRKIDSSNNVTTIAGQPGVFGSLNGKGGNATFGDPSGITIDEKGDLYVADNCTIRKIDANLNVTTIAGQPGVYVNHDGKGTKATFNYAIAITIDARGNLYVADSDTIRKIDTNLNVTTIAGQAGVYDGNHDGQGTNATFAGPSGIAVDAQGNLYVADKYNDIIRKIDTNLNVTTIAGQAGINGSVDGEGTHATFTYPTGILVDVQGNLIVVDSDTIRKIDNDNNVTTIAGAAGLYGSADGQGTNSTFNSYSPNFPASITADSHGNLYMTDEGNSIIRKIDGNSNVTTIAGHVGVYGAIDGPHTNANWFDAKAITLDTQGNIYVADNGNKTIWEIATNDTVIPIAGQTGVLGNADGQGTNVTFSYPRGIAVDGQSNLYVADNDTIRRIDTNNNVTTIAGEPGVSGSADGEGTNATFNFFNLTFPVGITVDAQGNIYVADEYNATIRKIDTNLNVTTIAGQVVGTGNTPPGTDGQGTNATFLNPTGIAADIQGNLYVADSQSIRKIDTNLNVTTIAGHHEEAGTSHDGQGTNATFDNTSGITVDAQGNLYVVDDETIRRIDSSSNVTTVAGQAAVSVSADGQGTNATFNNPTGIATESNGHLYISDLTTIREAAFLSASPSRQTINFKALHPKIYGDASFSLNATASSGLPVSFTSSNTNVAVVSSNIVSIVGAGNTTITASQLGNTNFFTAAMVSQILKVAKANQVIGFGKIPSQTYAPGSTFSLNATNSSELGVSYSSSNTNVAKISGNMVTITGAGNTIVTASWQGDPNYKAAAPVHQALSVAKATQTIVFMTPPTENFVQGARFNLSAISSSGLQASFRCSNPAVISIKGTTATIHAKGMVTITASQSGNGDYKAASSSVVVTVQ